MEIVEISASRLHEYARIPISFEVRSILEPELIEHGLGGIRFAERPVAAYLKDYDLLDPPAAWPGRFDLKNWGIFLARQGTQPVGGIVLAWHTAGVDLLDGREDLSVLWDIRVMPAWRRQGVGGRLFRRALAWSRERGCAQMKIETQNTNVAACRFYAAQGARLGDIRRFAYRGFAPVEHEIQLNWYFDC